MGGGSYLRRGSALVKHRVKWSGDGRALSDAGAKWLNAIIDEGFIWFCAERGKISQEWREWSGILWRFGMKVGSSERS